MKPAVKITVLLGAIAVAATGIWLWSLSGRQRVLTTAAPRTSLAKVTSPGAVATNSTLNPVPAARAPIPASVQPIVAAVTPTSFVERVKSIRALPADLTDKEIHAFYTYLLAAAPASAGNRQQENWLRNVMLDKLAEDPVLPEGLAGVLVAIYQDPAQDIVMRDYAVQHITPIYARASAEEKTTLQQTLWSAVAETDSSLAGTALLALRDLAQDHREFDQSKLGETALKLAGDDRCGELSRITALQLCGRMGINQAAPLLLQLAQTPGSVPMQIAAIAALGDVGDAVARNYLQQLAVKPDPRLRPALETAIKKMKARSGI